MECGLFRGGKVLPGFVRHQGESQDFSIGVSDMPTHQTALRNCGHCAAHRKGQQFYHRQAQAHAAQVVQLYRQRKGL